MSYAKFLAFGTPNPKKKPHEMFYMCHFFLNILQYALKFASALFTFIIIYITFLFMRGPLPLSPHLLFISSVSLFPSLTNIYSLSHFLVQPFLCSPSLYSTSLPPSPTKPRLEHQARPISTAMVSFFLFSFFSFWFCCDLMVYSDGQISGGWVRIGRSPSTTQRRPPTQPHEPDLPHP